MVINQGDLFWVNLGEPSGSKSGHRCLNVVIQNNVFNRSHINTILVCVVTPNLKRATAPGNILLDAGEANLSSPHVINISQVLTLTKDQFQEKVGTVSVDRIREILDGVRLITEPREVQ